jgi:hypothetical protein
LRPGGIRAGRRGPIVAGIDLYHRYRRPAEVIDTRRQMLHLPRAMFTHLARRRRSRRLLAEARHLRMR